MAEGSPIPGHRPQSEATVAQVRYLAEAEERLLRHICTMRDSVEPARFDQRWLSIAQTQIEQGFMALKRAILQPERVRLPGDEVSE